jgi:hypothetical protein
VGDDSRQVKSSSAADTLYGHESPIQQGFDGLSQIARPIVQIGLLSRV